MCYICCKRSPWARIKLTKSIANQQAKHINSLIKKKASDGRKVETGFEPMFSDYEPDKLPTTKFYQIIN
jgi:hypothetical protein